MRQLRKAMHGRRGLIADLRVQRGRQDSAPTVVTRRYERPGWNIQWSIEPFKSYRNYFNVYMIEVESAVSGISCDPDDGNVRRETPLPAEYAATCPATANARGITFGTGGSAAVERDRARDPGRRGGEPADADARQHEHLRRHRRHATRRRRAASPQGPLISPHELGHSLGGLQDEYPYSTRNVPGGALHGRRAVLDPPHDPARSSRCSTGS